MFSLLTCWGHHQSRSTLPAGLMAACSWHGSLQQAAVSSIAPRPHSWRTGATASPAVPSRRPPPAARTRFRSDHTPYITILHSPLKYSTFLTLNDTDHFATLDGTRGIRPPGVWPRIELKLRTWFLAPRFGPVVWWRLSIRTMHWLTRA